MAKIHFSSDGMNLLLSLKLTGKNYISMINGSGFGQRKINHKGEAIALIAHLTNWK